MYKKLLVLILSFLYINYVIAGKNPQKIVVVVPLEHEAMTQIVSGIKESLSSTNSEIIVQNAQGDLNIMLSLIKQIERQNIDIVMPIGSMASQMVISYIKDKPVVCVAADLKPDSKLVTGVNDEVPITASISKMPKLQNIGVIYSANEKVFPEIEVLKSYAKEHNITMHFGMIQTLVDLPSVVGAMPEKIDAFLILKDHLVVSGINILIKEARKRGIPVIASDEGSVINGATLAIGVQEKSIGLISGGIVKKILEGVNPGDIAYKTIDKLSVFTNIESFKNQKILTKDDIAGLKLSNVIVSGRE